MLDAIVDGCTNAEEDRIMPSVGWGGRFNSMSLFFKLAQYRTNIINEIHPMLQEECTIVY